MNGVVSSLRKLRLFLVVLGIGAGCFLLSSKAPAQSVLVSATNEVWRYFDFGQDLGIAPWRSLNFIEDYRWKWGMAEFGYGLSPEGHPALTPVQYGLDPANKYITTYFRKIFVITNVLSISNLTLTLQSLNGGVVYLNYFEAYRNLMPPGPIA